VHWSLDEILDLEHPVRIRIIEEIGKIHDQLAADQAGTRWPE
jgi:hypothetical protein